MAHRARWHRIGVSVGGEAWIIPVIHETPLVMSHTRRRLGFPVLRLSPSSKRCDVLLSVIVAGYFLRLLALKIWIGPGRSQRNARARIFSGSVSERLGEKVREPIGSVAARRPVPCVEPVQPVRIETPEGRTTFGPIRRAGPPLRCRHRRRCNVRRHCAVRLVRATGIRPR